MAAEHDAVESILAALEADPAPGAGAPATDDPQANEVLRRLEAGDGAPDQDAGETAADTTTEAVEPEPQAQAIEPPASWKAEWKDQFKALPPEAQKIIAERESERDKGLSKSQQESADARKAAEAERTAVQAERQAYVNGLNSLITELSTTDPIIAEGRKTDWVAEYRNDPTGAPARHLEYQQREGMLANRTIERNRMVEAQRNEKFREGHALLSEKLDFWQDEGKRTAFQQELAKSLTDHYGFKPEEAANIEDARAMLVARDALRWRQHEAQMAKVVPIKAKAPKVMPTQPQNEANKDARAEALKRGAIRSGRTDDAVAAIMATL